MEKSKGLYTLGGSLAGSFKEVTQDPPPIIISNKLNFQELSILPEEEVSQFWKFQFAGRDFFATLKNRIIRSSNGISWQEVPIPSMASTLIGHFLLTYGKSRFICAKSGRRGLFYSLDLQTWRECSYPYTDYNQVHNYPECLDFNSNNSTFVSVSDGTSSTSYNYYTNGDGTSWNAASKRTYHTPIDIAHSKDRFVCVTGIVDPSNIVIRSGSGSSWMETELPYTEKWQSITCDDNNKFIAVNNSNLEKSVISSTDKGNTWVDEILPIKEKWHSIRYGAGISLVVGENTDKYCFEDSEGWHVGQLPMTLGSYPDVKFGNNKFLIFDAQSRKVFGADVT